MLVWNLRNCFRLLSGFRMMIARIQRKHPAGLSRKLDIQGIECHGCSSGLHGNAMHDWLYIVVRSGCLTRFACKAGQGCLTGLFGRAVWQGCLTRAVCQGRLPRLHCKTLRAGLKGRLSGYLVGAVIPVCEAGKSCSTGLYVKVASQGCVAKPCVQF